MSEGRNVGWDLTTLGVACCFGMGHVCARVAYEHGSNALTVVTLRSIGALLILAVLLRIDRLPMLPPPGQRMRTAALGLLLLVQSFSLNASYQYMPVGLALIVFYLCPIFILLANAALDRRRLALGECVAPVVAFLGLCLALAPAQASWRFEGVAFALASAIAFTGMLVISSRYFGKQDPRPRNLLMCAVVVPIFGMIGVGTQGYALPDDALAGWIGLLMVPLLYSTAFIVMFFAVRARGPSRTSMLLNFEPVAAMAFAWVILEQSYMPVQLAGAAVVIAAVVWAAKQPLHRA